MRVAMGWTCQCRHWCPSINDIAAHQAAMLDEAGLLAAETGGPVTEHDRTKMREVLAVAARGGGSGEPGDWADNLADAQLNHLADCGYRIVPEQEITEARNE